MTSAVVFAINEYIMQYSDTTMQVVEDERVELLLSLDATDNDDETRNEIKEASCALVGIDAHDTTSSMNYGSIPR